MKNIGSTVKRIWLNLGKPIYVGDRLKANMRALTGVSVFTAVLGLVLIGIDIYTHQIKMLIPSFFTFLGGVSCAYCAHVLKNRKIAILIPTGFCLIFFTVYAFTGAGKGTAILWSLLLPIGISYFVSVRYGIILSGYYIILFSIVFYSPYWERFRMYYNKEFVERFPIVFASLSIFTGMAMIQYHRMALLEIEYTDSLNEEVARQTAVAEERSRKIEQISLQTIQTLANAIDAKDPYTKGHSTRVSQYSMMIAEKLGWEKDRINDLRYAALLHDVGKIGVPDSILNNPRKLTDVEYDIIKSHTTMGGDILKDKTIIAQAEDVARSHHERYDGNGYPMGLKGEEISEEARIVAIADAFDAMNSTRIYRKACDKDHVRRELTEGRGKQFDPDFTDIFIDLWDNGALDQIMKNDVDADEENVEVSSVLLQEVMDAFVSQGAADNTDITTGIMNRTAGEAAIADIMKTERGCLAFIDVDNLKKINDISGHEAGDRVLKLMGDTLKDNSEDGICCRLGGDEFLIFMINASKKDAKNKIRKIISEFEEKKNEDVEISVASLSAGMVMCTPSDTYTRVYNMADKALYHVKQNGKSGYSFYNNEYEAVRNEQVDVNRLVTGIRTSGSYDGAMDVEYRQFTKLYEFIANLEKRFSYPFKLIMITLETTSGEDPNPEELEKGMFFMEQSIRQTMRNVDIITRYSRQQFLLLLIGSDPEGAKIAVDRIFKGYYKMSGNSAFSPSYSVADL